MFDLIIYIMALVLVVGFTIQTYIEMFGKTKEERNEQKHINYIRKLRRQARWSRE
jgi:glycopeptide antibiotics resistance protein